MQKPELLAPAGNLEKLKMAVIYGADAVYLGGQRFGLRAAAGNFTMEELEQGLEFAHARGVKVYVTVNIFFHNEDLNGLEEYLEEIFYKGVDGIIVSDPGVIALARDKVPGLAIHLSTQANTTNWASAGFWENQGIRRLVLARELSLGEIKEIKARTGLQLEVFVHGAMCMSYSGRCLMSNYMAHRDANRGECAQPCRWKYSLVEETRPGRFFPIEEDERGTYIFNSHDLSMLEHLPELLDTGVSSLKIEGRMKSIHYVATVVKVYRQALDEFFRDPLKYRVKDEWKREIAKVSHRDYTTGFYFGSPTFDDHTYGTSAYLRYYDFVGVVLDYDLHKGMALVEQRNKMAVGDLLELVGPAGDPLDFVLEEMHDEAGEQLQEAPHPQQKIWMKMPQAGPCFMLRRLKAEEKE